jgi:parallel beta-helix repeat protein
MINQNNISSNNWYDGVYIYGGMNNTVFDNYVFDNQYGVHQRSTSNNTIFNNTFVDNGFGIYSEDSSHDSVLSNYMIGNSNGIFLRDSSYYKMENNNLTQGYNGIHIYQLSHNNSITSNYLNSNFVGVRMDSAKDNVFDDNNFVNDNFLIMGDHVSHFNSQTIPTTNIANGEPVYYIKDTNNLDIDGLVLGQLILANCTNFDVRNLNSSNKDVGVELGFCSNGNLSSNVMSNNSYGIYLVSVSNVTVDHNDVYDNFQEGIHLEDSVDTWITKNHVYGTYWNGIWARSELSNLISENDIYLNKRGILFETSNCTIVNNNISENDIGILAGWSDNNLIARNNLSENHRGIDFDWSWDNIISENRITNSTSTGIVIADSNNNIITANNFSFQEVIYVTRSTNTIITGNDFYLNQHRCVMTYLSSATTVEGNNFISNMGEAVYLYQSSNSEIISNQIINTTKDGIYIRESWGNRIIGNNISENRGGIYSDSLSYSNAIIGNNLVGNINYGVNLSTSWDNKVYHNNFVSNGLQAYDNGTNNLWNDSYPSGGNYWSDYIGLDNMKGPLQDIPGSDGIGDTNHTIDPDSLDHYPLILPRENYIVLKPGWNLISLPLIQNDQDLTKVLERIDGYYDAVQWYDNKDPLDNWKHHKVGKPFGNDLFTLNESMGFWIHITSPGDTIFLYNGTQPLANQNIHLQEGWNLVGYPSLSDHNRTHGMNNLQFGTEVDVIQWYDATTQSWHFMGPNDNFEKGRGYWVHSKVSTVWEVPL